MSQLFFHEIRIKSKKEMCLKMFSFISRLPLIIKLKNFIHDLGISCFQYRGKDGAGSGLFHKNSNKHIAT